MNKNTILGMILWLVAASCSDLFEPAKEFNRDLDDMYNQPSYAQGILGYAYNQLPFIIKSETDVATDDAVSNNSANTYLSMATGAWTSQNNPMDVWQRCRSSIQHVNIFLENVDQVHWADDEKVRLMYCDRMKGEAYALRAVNLYYLLRAHGGWTAGGELLGVPNVTYSLDADSEFNLPRSTFQDCIGQIRDDVSLAIELLPTEYRDVTATADIPAKYREMGITAPSDYNRVNGVHLRGRVNGSIAEAIWAQAALLAASPAYAEGTTVSYADAANAAAVVLDRIGGTDGIDPLGHTWYMNTAAINALGAGDNLPEILWRGDRDNSSADYQIGLQQEVDNFPPSLYGNGRINPSQNLVDAFPMASGYPIGHDRSEYSSRTPYNKRDPRLSAYILCNGHTYKETTIITGTYSGNRDGINKESGYSTRTGYYLRKLLRDDCNPNPQFNTAQYHLPVFIRYTEIFLDYAEAANEAYGPQQKGGHNYSAYEVIKAIRQRGGIGDDVYLESIKTDQTAMRTLIRNERRIELCFENHRFYDLRRWKATLNETVQGMRINMQGDGNLEYNIIDVENRAYSDYMYYGPIPNSEILKWSELQQNKGW